MKWKERVMDILQRQLEKAVREREVKKKLIFLGKSRSFKEFLIRKLHYVVYDFLAERGISRWEAIRYFNFAKFCVSKAMDYGFKYIDQIFDLAEERFIERDGLKPEIVRDLEVLLINYLTEAPFYEEEYERVKMWYEKYKREVERKRRIFKEL